MERTLRFNTSVIRNSVKNRTRNDPMNLYCTLSGGYELKIREMISEFR